MGRFAWLDPPCDTSYVFKSSMKQRSTNLYTWPTWPFYHIFLDIFLAGHWPTCKAFHYISNQCLLDRRLGVGASLKTPD